MRLFIALPLSDEAQRGVAKVVKKIQRGHWPVRWVSEDKRHLTLVFLGQIEQVEKVVEAAKAGAREIEPFTLEFKGLGAFPDLLLPKVIWLGLKGDLKSLYRLAKSLDLTQDKPLQPHLTLGRIKPQMSRKQRLELGKIISKNRQLDIPQTWLVDRVVVYESILKRDGSEYRIIKEINL